MPPPVLFADAFYWVAVLSPRDPFHARVMSWGRSLGMTRLITTDEVLTEVLNWFSGAGPYWRGKAATFVHNLGNDPDVDVLPHTLVSLAPESGPRSMPRPGALLGRLC